MGRAYRKFVDRETNSGSMMMSSTWSSIARTHRPTEQGRKELSSRRLRPLGATVLPRAASQRGRPRNAKDTSVARTAEHTRLHNEISLMVSNAAVLPRHRFARARHWQRLTVLAGLVLTACFFLPVLTCRRPSAHLYEVVQQDWRIGEQGAVFTVDWATWLSKFLLHGAPYSLGLIASLLAFLRLSGYSGAHRVCASGMYALLLLTATGVVLLAIGGAPFDSYDPLISATWPNGLLTCVIFPAVAVAYASCARWRVQPAHLCYALVACLWDLGYGSQFLLHEYAAYGLYLAYGAIVTLLVCTIGEACTISCQSLQTTVWQLATCCLHEGPTGEPYCLRCGYCLIGLNRRRCPECGRPFSLQELGVSADVLAPAEGRATVVGETGVPTA